MATYSDIAHRWANKDFGCKGSLVAGNCSCDEYNFVSYNTVIGQWLDKDKNVMAIIDLGLSKSTAKHVSALYGAVPGSVKLFRFNLPGNYSQWNNVDLVDRYTPFDKRVRMKMVNLFIDNIFESFSVIKTSRSLNDEKIELKWWRYINELNEMYNNDASPKSWLKEKISNNLSKEGRRVLMQKRKMVRGLLEGLSNAEIVDSIWGKGTWAEYEKRVAPLRKAEHAREYAKKVNRYLLADNGWSRKPVYSYKQIKAMSPSQLTRIKFANLEKSSYRYEEMLQHKSSSMARAIRYIGLFPTKDRYYGDNTFTAVFNHFTGEQIYFLERPRYCYDYHENIDVKFGKKEFQSFCESTDKKHWLNRFYAICTIKRNRIIAKNIDNDITSGKRTRDDLTPEEISLYDAYLERQVRYQANCAKKEKIAKEKANAEREARLQKLEEYRNGGMEGLRNMWRDRFGDIPKECACDEEYYYGGNVLLRFKDEDTVETSKGIRLSVKVCKLIFMSIKSWHENPNKFKPTEVNTKNCGTFKITSYNNDIMVAGCHRIAYEEMERMYREIINKAA